MVFKMLNNFCDNFGVGKDTLAIQKRIRIQLFNIGTNPMKRGVIFFLAEIDQELVSKSTFGARRTLTSRAIQQQPPVPTFGELPNQPESEAGPNHMEQRRGDRCTVKIFKPSNMPMLKIQDRIEAYSSLAFRDIDKTRFGFDLFAPRPPASLRQAAESYDRILALVNEYVQLMIKMSESLNDESLNQVKNVGLTEDFCLAFMRRPDAHPMVKTSLLQLFMKLHMSSGYKATEADLYAFSFEKLNKLNLLLSTSDACNSNRGDQSVDFSEKRKTELLLLLLRGDPFRRARGYHAEHGRLPRDGRRAPLIRREYCRLHERGTGKRLF